MMEDCGIQQEAINQMEQDGCFFFGFARWHLRQTYDFTKDISKKILKTLSTKDILKLGFHAITKLNEKKSDLAGQRGNLKYAIANYKKILKDK